MSDDRLQVNSKTVLDFVNRHGYMSCVGRDVLAHLLALADDFAYSSTTVRELATLIWACSDTNTSRFDIERMFELELDPEKFAAQLSYANNKELIDKIIEISKHQPVQYKLTPHNVVLLSHDELTDRAVFCVHGLGFACWPRNYSIMRYHAADEEA